MEYVVCSTCLTIASAGPHHTVDVGRNRGVGGEWCNSVGGFRGGDVFVFEVFSRVGVALVGFEVDGDMEFG